MTEQQHGSDRLGRRVKRFLTPLQKYELWLQLVRGETTISEAADRYGVDRSTIMRLRTVAKDGPLQALAESKQPRRDLELEAAQAEAARLGEAVRGAGGQLVLVEGTGVRACWPGPAPVDAATKSGLVDSLCQPPGPAGRCGPPVRCWRSVSCASTSGWVGAAGELEDQAPGGSPMHGLLDWEVAEIVRLFGVWGEVDAPHRKLAHRGSHLERVWVSPASVPRVLEREGRGCGRCPGRHGRSASRSRTGSSTGQGRSGSTTQPTLPAPGVAATVVEDLVSRKWLAWSSTTPEVLNSQQAHTQDT